MTTQILVVMNRESTVLEEAEVMVEVPDDVPEEGIERAAEVLAWDAINAGQVEWKEVDSETSDVTIEIQYLDDEENDKT